MSQCRVLPPNGSRLSCGRPARRRKAVGRQSVPRQGHNTPLPLRRSPPGSFKRLLDSGTLNVTLLLSALQAKKLNKKEEGQEVDA